MSEKDFIKNCFDILVQRNPETLNIDDLFEYDEDYKIIVPKNMRVDDDPHNWKLVESEVKEEDINKLEKTFNIKLPSLYKAFLSTYYHMLQELTGTLDNYLFEDDVEVYIELISQPSDNPLLQLKTVWGEFDDILEFGYIPIGDFNKCGPLCIDIFNDNILVWLDHEEYYNCESREELEDLALPIFSDFKGFMECFFCGKKYECIGIN